jgi:hypothetical protein
MKLIIEKWSDGTIYSYRETEKHFKSVEVERKKRAKKVKIDILDYECNLHYMEDGTYIVVDIKK